jgi:putative phosphoribosyl transferase
MLIVGSRDSAVLDLNQRTRSHMHCENELVVVPGASHLFEEPGTLVLAATEATRWFAEHFAAASAPSGVPLLSR